jgi:hypothetical protein
MPVSDEVKKIFVFSGLTFMFMSTILFYNHLITASLSDSFSVIVYFNAFGEGTFELVMFLIFIPFIAYAYFSEYMEITRRVRRRKRNVGIGEVKE